MNTHDVYYYEVDGGMNPSHHHPATKEINQEDGKYQVGLNGNIYPTLAEAEEELLQHYDRVIYTGLKVVFIQHTERVIKWENTPRGKNILFVSNDGVKIYEGDFWWYVLPNSTKYVKASTLAYRGKNIVDRLTIARFSTPDAAHDYIVKQTKL